MNLMNKTLEKYPYLVFLRGGDSGLELNKCISNKVFYNLIEADPDCLILGFVWQSGVAEQVYSFFYNRWDVGNSDKFAKNEYAGIICDYKI